MLNYIYMNVQQDMLMKHMVGTCFRQNVVSEVYLCSAYSN